MQQQELIHFKKERDLGEILSDTFKFIRLNYKPLIKVIVRAVGPVMLVMLLSYFAYNFIVLKGSNGFLSAEFEKNISELTSKFAVTFFLGMVFIIVVSVLFYAIFYAAINFSVQSYIENNGEIKVEEVTEQVKYNWMSFFGLAFLAGMLMMAGMIFCVIPAVYLFVPLSLVFSIMVFNNMGITESLGYSFKLIKNNWWMSFLILFLMMIIYYIGASVFQIPAMIYTLIRTMISVGSSASISFSNIYDWPYFVLSLLGSLAQFVLYVFFIVSTVFLFFSLDEKHNQTGAFEAIKNLGREE